MKKRRIILNILIILLCILIMMVPTSIIIEEVFTTKITTTISAIPTLSKVAGGSQEGQNGGQGGSQGGQNGGQDGSQGGQNGGQGGSQGGQNGGQEGSQGGQNGGQDGSQGGQNGGQGGSQEDNNDEFANTSEYDYNHLDIRVNTSCIIEDVEYEAEDVSIVVVTTSGENIILISTETTTDENSDEEIEEYQSEIGHSEGESLQLMQEEIIYVTLSFKYYDGSEYVTTSVTLEYELLEENNECEGGSLGYEVYGYDITVNVADYVEVAESERTYNYTVKYIDVNTGEEIKDEKTVEDITVNTQISALDEVIDIDGYTYIKTNTTILNISSNEEENVIISYYAKDTSVIVYYLNYTTGEQITEYETIEGYEGLAYTTEQKGIDGYTFVKSTDNTSGEMTSEIIYVYYYYTQVTTVTESGEFELPSAGGFGDTVFITTGVVCIALGIMIRIINKDKLRVSRNRISRLEKSVYNARRKINNRNKR